MLGPDLTLSASSLLQTLAASGFPGADGAGWAGVAALALSAGAGALLARFSRLNHPALKGDGDQICATLDRAMDGDFSDRVLDLEHEAFRDVGKAVERLMPQLRKTIEELEWDAQHDPLTELYNAATFKRRCRESLMESARLGFSGALLYLDINEFKQINDGLGHHAGDRLLVTVADRLRLAVSTFSSGKLSALAEGLTSKSMEPILARLGGDEFAIYLPGNFSRSDVERFIQRMRRLAGEPCQIGPHSVRNRLAIGIAFASDQGHVYEQLLAAADTAMYTAKARGEEVHCFFEEGMRSEADRILEREIELRNALRSGQFCLNFQPQLNLDTRRIESAEALIRWHHPIHGVIMPSEFIPFAETYDLIDEIGDWVINEAIRTAARWWAAGQTIRISINVSPKQLNRIELIATIRACLSRYALPPHALEIEVTEAAIMRSDEVGLERINGLRADGVCIALDDFGTGYSNIAQLLSLPMDRLKLDRSLVKSSRDERRNKLVTKAIIELSRKMGFEVVAEGVEDESDLNFLRRAKCTFAQGYLIAPPLAEEDLLELVRRTAEGSATSHAA